MLPTARVIMKKERYTFIAKDLGIYKQIARAHFRLAIGQRFFPCTAHDQVKAQIAVAHGIGMPHTESVAWRGLAKHGLRDVYCCLLMRKGAFQNGVCVEWKKVKV